MNTKSLCFRTAVALTSLASVASLNSTAQAFTLTGENTLALSGRAKFNTASGVLNFRDIGAAAYNTPTGVAIITTSSSGRFENLFGELATLKDITLTSQGIDIWEYKGPTLTNFITVDSIGFSLSAFKLIKNPGNEWMATVEGQFQDTELPAFGKFDPLQDDLFAQTGGNGSSYSFDIEEVPSPALLPGLIGMGAMALRRKNDNTSDESA